MSLTPDEIMFIQSQLEGLESIFLELMPFGVELKRQQVQDYYNQRLDFATKPTATVAETELRRQFNSKANQVRNLVDSAQSLGNAINRLNLIWAAASLPAQRHQHLDETVNAFCQNLISNQKVDAQKLSEIKANTQINSVEARVLLGSVMFLIVDELDDGGKPIKVQSLLSDLINFVTKKKLLETMDPFLIEAKCFLEAIEKDEAK